MYSVYKKNQYSWYYTNACAISNIVHDWEEFKILCKLKTGELLTCIVTWEEDFYEYTDDEDNTEYYEQCIMCLYEDITNKYVDENDITKFRVLEEGM